MIVASFPVPVPPQSQPGRHSESRGQLLGHGLRSPLDLFAVVPIAVLDGASCRAADPAGLSFVNINSPDDLASLSSAAGLREEHDLV